MPGVQHDPLPTAPPPSNQTALDSALNAVAGQAAEVGALGAYRTWEQSLPAGTLQQMIPVGGDFVLVLKMTTIVGQSTKLQIGSIGADIIPITPGLQIDGVPFDELYLSNAGPRDCTVTLLIFDRR